MQGTLVHNILSLAHYNITSANAYLVRTMLSPANFLLYTSLFFIFKKLCKPVKKSNANKIQVQASVQSLGSKPKIIVAKKNKKGI
jgi:hypothetical protein